ncbi:MAG: hypothetical protein ACYC9Y_14975, partial [Candidatus Methylomirabilia bacterium]
VDQYRNIVAPMKILAHTPILRRKRRGIIPQEIEWPDHAPEEEGGKQDENGNPEDALSFSFTHLL